MNNNLTWKKFKESDYAKGILFVRQDMYTKEELTNMAQNKVIRSFADSYYISADKIKEVNLVQRIEEFRLLATLKDGKEVFVNIEWV